MRECQFTCAVQHVLRGHVICDQKQGEVADRLGCRRDFDYVAQQLIDVGIDAADFAPAITETQCSGLLKQVSVLAAGHFVLVQIGSGRQHGALERPVKIAYGSPVFGDRSEVLWRQARVAVSEPQRFNDCIEVRLRSPARHWSHGDVGNVQPDFGRLQDRRCLDAGSVVRVEVDRDADLLLERFD